MRAPPGTLTAGNRKYGYGSGNAIPSEEVHRSEIGLKPLVIRSPPHVEIMIWSRFSAISSAVSEVLKTP
jgi:hypothetical protein